MACQPIEKGVRGAVRRLPGRTYDAGGTGEAYEPIELVGRDGAMEIPSAHDLRTENRKQITVFEIQHRSIDQRSSKVRHATQRTKLIAGDGKGGTDCGLVSNVGGMSEYS